MSEGINASERSTGENSKADWIWTTIVPLDLTTKISGRRYHGKKNSGVIKPIFISASITYLPWKCKQVIYLL